MSQGSRENAARMALTPPSYESVQAHAEAVGAQADRLVRIARRLRSGSISTDTAAATLRMIADELLD